MRGFKPRIQMHHLPSGPLPPLRLQASAAARHALTSASTKLLLPLTLTQLPRLVYPCSHSHCQTRRLLITLTLSLIPLTLTLWPAHHPAWPSLLRCIAGSPGSALTPNHNHRTVGSALPRQYGKGFLYPLPQPRRTRCGHPCAKPPGLLKAVRVMP